MVLSALVEARDLAAGGRARHAPPRFAKLISRSLLHLITPQSSANHVGQADDPEGAEVRALAARRDGTLLWPFLFTSPLPPRSREALTTRAKLTRRPECAISGTHSCAITLCVLFSPRCSFMIAVAGIFGGFSYMAVKQEDVYKTAFGKTEGKNANPGEKFAFTFFALAAERGINALIALAGVLVFGGSGNKIPKMEIFNSGVSQMLAMAASGEATPMQQYHTEASRASPASLSSSAASTGEGLGLRAAPPPSDGPASRDSMRAPRSQPPSLAPISSSLCAAPDTSVPENADDPKYAGWPGIHCSPGLTLRAAHAAHVLPQLCASRSGREHLPLALTVVVESVGTEPTSGGATPICRGSPVPLATSTGEVTVRLRTPRCMVTVASSPIERAESASSTSLINERPISIETTSMGA